MKNLTQNSEKGNILSRFRYLFTYLSACFCSSYVCRWTMNHSTESVILLESLYSSLNQLAIQSVQELGLFGAVFFSVKLWQIREQRYRWIKWKWICNRWRQTWSCRQGLPYVEHLHVEFVKLWTTLWIQWNHQVKILIWLKEARHETLKRLWHYLSERVTWHTI